MPGRSQTIHDGHADVHQNDIGPVPFVSVQGITAIGALLDFICSVGEGSPQHSPNPSIIVNDQYLHTVFIVFPDAHLDQD